MDNEKIQLFYPFWVKALGIIGIPLLAIAGLWMSSRPLFEEELSFAQQMLFPIMGIAVLYQCYIGTKCYKSFSTVITLNEYGIKVNSNGESKDYYWKSLMVEHYAFATTILVKHMNGEPVGYFSEGLENLDLLVNAIEKNT